MKREEENKLTLKILVKSGSNTKNKNKIGKKRNIKKHKLERET